MDNFEEDKIWKANEETKRQDEVDGKSPTNLEGETENSSEAQGSR